jgi:hypothetical protein
LVLSVENLNAARNITSTKQRHEISIWEATVAHKVICYDNQINKTFVIDYELEAYLIGTLLPLHISSLPTYDTGNGFR